MAIDGGKLDEAARLHARMDEIRHDYIDDPRLEHLRTGCSGIVWGFGMYDAEVMCIGEAPGADEDAEGMPFVGRSGQLMNELLEPIWPRERCYVTNVVKYRPPGNRDPHQFEVLASLPYLWREIALVRPTIILTWGRHALQVFVPGGKISQIHGVWQDNVFKPGHPAVDAEHGPVPVLLPLYHPSACLRYPPNLAATKQDLLQLAAVVDLLH